MERPATLRLGVAAIEERSLVGAQNARACGGKLPSSTHIWSERYVEIMPRRDRRQLNGSRRATARLGGVYPAIGYEVNPWGMGALS